jgi:hypothetical protein
MAYVLDYEFEKHEPCPECRKNGRDRSGNNLGRWKDGHAWCFSCGYFEKAPLTALPSSFVPRSQVSSIAESKSSSLNKPIPTGASIHLGWEALTWLRQYGITEDEVRQQGLLWSDVLKWLIFPYYSELNNIVGWQARTFNPQQVKDKKKWFTFGDMSNHMQLYGVEENRECDTIVIVEDVVSAMKIGRHWVSMPMFGSYLPLKNMNRIKKLGFDNVAIWMDPDKVEDSRRTAARIRQFGVNSFTIETLRDPKEYSDVEIFDSITRGERSIENGTKSSNSS